MLPCIVFSIFFGVALVLVGDKAQPVLKFFDSCLEAMNKVVGIIMNVAPIGIFALVAAGVGANGKELISTLGLLAILNIVATVILLVGYVVINRFTTKVPFSKLIPAYGKVAVTAFSTRSSAATLPLTMRTAVEELECDKEISDFMLLIGCTINMHGFICELCLIAVLAGNFYGTPLTLGQCVIAVIIAVLSGVGMPGIPNAGSLFYVMLFSALGLPNGVLIGMLLGVESILDMFATSTNVCGDLACTSIVTASERKRTASKKISA